MKNTLDPSVAALAVGLLAVPVAFLAPASRQAAVPFLTLAASTPDVTVTDAPVPAVPDPGRSGSQSPMNRAAQVGAGATDSGPVASTPFSAGPSTALSAGGTEGSESERVRAPADGAGVVPNLGK